MPIAPVCTNCGTYVQPDWDWCMACGFDPSHLKPAGWKPPEQAQRHDPAYLTTARTGWAPPAGPAAGERFASTPAPAARSAGAVIGLIVFVIAAIAVVGFVGLKTVGQQTADSTTGRASTPSVAPTTLAPTTTADPWVIGRASDGSFTARFPTTPREDSSPGKGGAPTTNLASADLNANVYAVSRTALGPGLSPAKEREALAAIGSDKGAGTASSAPTTFRDHAASTFEVHTADGTAIKGIAVIKDGTLYSLYVSGPEGIAQAQRFFDSFTFTA